MRKQRPPFEDEGHFTDGDRDYKLDQVAHDLQQNYQSTTRWLYLGVDAFDSTFAKIGITMGDLRSRSYSSARPTYYLFCAFKYNYNISKEETERIERDVLWKIDCAHKNPNGSSKRLYHFESGEISECFAPVDFAQFFIDLHSIIYNDHRSSFLICEFEHGGEFVDCIFNSKTPLSHVQYIKMLLQY